MNIGVKHILKTFDNHTALSDVSFTIKSGERVGIVGANGSGKSTLLRILAGIEDVDEGDVDIPKKATIRYVPQAPEYSDTETVQDILSPLVAAHEGYKIDKALTMLDLLDCKEQQFAELSGGQKTRIYLARIITESCDLLLLDEPTNHLDIKTLEWLENYLKCFEGTIFVVSHDREFLDNVVNRIFEIEESALSAYGGNYSFYKEQKAIEQEGKQRAYKAQQKEIRRLEATTREMRQEEEKGSSKKQTQDNDKFAVGFSANRTAKKKGAAAKSVESHLESMEPIEKPRVNEKPKMLFTPAQNGSQIMALFDQVRYSSPNTTILSDISFQIDRGERIALSGLNGAGKTTLVKLLLGQLQPDEGEVSLGQSTKIGYLSQEHEELQSSHSTLEELTDRAGIDKTFAHRLLAWLLMPREKIRKPVNTLSKGEQSKVLLAELIASGANFIILDEPVNHLDMRSREAVEEALREYPGTLLVISHDRYFIDAINTTKHLYLEKGRLSR